MFLIFLGSRAFQSVAFVDLTETLRSLSDSNWTSWACKLNLDNELDGECCPGSSEGGLVSTLSSIVRLFSPSPFLPLFPLLLPLLLPLLSPLLLARIPPHLSRNAPRFPPRIPPLLHPLLHTLLHTLHHHLHHLLLLLPPRLLPRLLPRLFPRLLPRLPLPCLFLVSVVVFSVALSV